MICGSNNNYRFRRGEVGSALVLAIIIVTVVTILCSCILLGVALQNRLISQVIHKQQALYLAEAGIHKTIWYLSGNDNRNINWRPVREQVDLFDRMSASVTVEAWGAYLCVTSAADYKGQTRCVQSIIGEQPASCFNDAVCVGNIGYPLVVTGNNRITGDVTIGLKGVETGRIKGRGFEGKQPVDGDIKKVMKSELPGLCSELFNNAIHRYRQILKMPDVFVSVNSDTIIDSLYVPSGKNIFVDGNLTFCNSAVVPSSNDPIVIACSGNLTIEDNVRFGSGYEFVVQDSILISGNTQIDDCILFAEKKIRVMDQSRLSGQLLCPTSIVIGGSALLDFPSVLFCNGIVSDEILRGEIVIKDWGVVKGSLILCHQENGSIIKRDETAVVVETDARLAGVLFSQNRTVFKGTVYGSVVTGGFYLYIAPTSYLNWLCDSVIDRPKLPKSFVMPISFSKHPRLEIIDWREKKIDRSNIQLTDSKK